MKGVSRKTGELSVKEIKKKGSLYVVSLSDGQRLELSEETLLEYPLYANKKVSEAFLKLITDFQNSLKAYKQCLSLLDKRPYTVHQIWVKLEEKGLEENQIKTLIAKFIDQGLLDDTRYIREYYENVSSVKNIGYLRVINELKEKGIASNKLTSLHPNKSFEKKKAVTYMATLLKRYAKLPSKAKYQKIRNCLKLRGFEDYAIAEAMDNFISTDPKQEKASLEKDYKAALNRYKCKYEGYQLRSHLCSYLLSKGYSYSSIEDIINKEDSTYE